MRKHEKKNKTVNLDPSFYKKKMKLKEKTKKKLTTMESPQVKQSRLAESKQRWSEYQDAKKIFHGIAFMFTASGSVLTWGALSVFWIYSFIRDEMEAKLGEDHFGATPIVMGLSASFFFVIPILSFFLDFLLADKYQRWARSAYKYIKDNEAKGYDVSAYKADIYGYGPKGEKSENYFENNCRNARIVFGIILGLLCATLLFAGVGMIAWCVSAMTVSVPLDSDSYKFYLTFLIGTCLCGFAHVLLIGYFSWSFVGVEMRCRGFKKGEVAYVRQKNAETVQMEKIRQNLMTESMNPKSAGMFNRRPAYGV